jgi:hypothetical protein
MELPYKVEIPVIESSCVVKVWYDGKYIIAKCKTLGWLKYSIETDIKYFLKNTPKGRKEGNLFYDLYSYILENQGKELSVEVIFTSDSPFELLKAEHMELKKATQDPRCLNKDFEPYIPKFTQINGKKSWINRGYYLNYMNWKRKFAIQSMIG